MPGGRTAASIGAAIACIWSAIGVCRRGDEVDATTAGGIAGRGGLTADMERRDCRRRESTKMSAQRKKRSGTITHGDRCSSHPSRVDDPTVCPRSLAVVRPRRIGWRQERMAALCPIGRASSASVEVASFCATGELDPAEARHVTLGVEWRRRDTERETEERCARNDAQHDQPDRAQDQRRHWSRGGGPPWTRPWRLLGSAGGGAFGYGASPTRARGSDTDDSNEGTKGGRGDQHDRQTNELKPTH